jgi:biopolymer transport protein ExbD
MKLPREEFQEPKLIIVPLVDVLLAVFLFLAILAFKEPLVSILVQLPKGQGTEANLKVVNIQLDAKGNVYLGGKPVSKQELKKFLTKQKSLLVNLMADQRTPYKYVAQILSLLQNLNITNVNLVLKR